MNPGCERWVALGDQEAVGDVIGEADRRFLEEHEQTCAQCAAEALAWRALEEDAETEAPDVARASAVSRILEAYGADERALATAVPRRTRPRWLWNVPRRNVVVVSTLAVAATVLLRVVVRDGGVPGQALAAVASTDGDSTLDGQPVVVGARLPVGATLRAGRRACVAIEGGVRACLGAGSEARFADGALAHRVLELRRGHIDASLDHQRVGTRFSIDTREGKVTAVGTAFSVDVPVGVGPVRVRVDSGVVLVEPTAGAARRLRAGEQAALGAPAQPTLTPNQPLAPPVPTASTAPTGTPRDLPSPVSVPSTTPVPPVSPGERRAGTTELLEQARALRGEGDFRGAEGAYVRLESLYPGSAEAHASLVSLGDLELSQLEDAAAALRAFDAYLVKGGTLSQEAALGRISALRSLGRATDERRAIEDFLAAYPSTLRTDSLRLRLHELVGPGASHAP